MLRISKLAFILLALFSTYFSKSQEIFGQPDAWTSMTFFHDFKKPWTVGTEVHWRMNNWVKKQQFIIRPYFTYRHSKHVEYSLGYTYSLTYPYDKYPLPKVTPEHNAWEQIVLKHSANKVKFTHRYRLEQRFVAIVNQDSTISFDRHNFTQRFRYRLSLGIPVHTKLSIILFN